MRCASGDKCREQRLAGERFCASHLAVLHRIRDEFNKQTLPAARVSRKPTCQTPGCANPRLPPKPLCAECAEGVVDELAA
jgi:hypothetical protein